MATVGQRRGGNPADLLKGRITRLRSAADACAAIVRAQAADGEGATWLLEVRVAGGASRHDARMAAQAVGGILLLKAAIFGADANWGRVLCAIGYSKRRWTLSGGMCIRLESRTDRVCKRRAGIPLTRIPPNRADPARGVMDIPSCGTARPRPPPWGWDLTRRLCEDQRGLPQQEAEAFAENARSQARAQEQRRSRPALHILMQMRVYAMKISPPTGAQVLTRALPYIKQFAGKTVVIKYGGNAMISEELKAAVMQDVVLPSTVGIQVVLVHGGGPEISAMLKKIGRRIPVCGRSAGIPTGETMEVVRMVLAGKVNKTLVQQLEAHGGRAIGLCGLDGGMIRRSAIGGGSRVCRRRHPRQRHPDPHQPGQRYHSGGGHHRRRGGRRDLQYQRRHRRRSDRRRPRGRSWC